MKTCIYYRNEIQKLFDNKEIDISIECLKKYQEVFNCQMCKNGKPQNCRFCSKPNDSAKLDLEKIFSNI